MAFYNIAYLSNKNDRNLELNTVCYKGMTRVLKFCHLAWENESEIAHLQTFQF